MEKKSFRVFYDTVNNYGMINLLKPNSYFGTTKIKIQKFYMALA